MRIKRMFPPHQPVRCIDRLSLELVFFIWVIATYRMYIPPRVTCYEGSVTCETEGSGEKTTFLWILTVVNLVSDLARHGWCVY